MEDPDIRVSVRLALHQTGRYLEAVEHHERALAAHRDGGP